MKRNQALLWLLVFSTLTISSYAQFVIIDPGLPGVEECAVSWGDYDNDGDLDVLMTGFTGSERLARIYRNDGGDSFININAGLVGIQNSSSAWGDFDNDGDLDVLLSGNNLEEPYYYTRIYRQNSNHTFTDINAGLTGMGSGSASWGDLDNDGDLDILVTGLDGFSTYAKVYRNNGNETFTAMTTSLIGLYQGDSALGDYDCDGDLDILLTGRDGSNINYSKIYRNDSNFTFTEINAGLIGLKWGSCGWGDYDNDGDLDILLTGYNSTSPNYYSIVYCNDADTLFTDIGAGLTGLITGSCDWGDYDNDGDLDILLTGNNNTSPYYHTKLYRNDGVSGFIEIAAGLPGIYTYSDCAWGDYDNDGDLDILLAGATSGSTRICRLYRNDYGYTNNPPAAPSGLQSNRNGEYVNFSWSASSDDHTPSDGLNYALRIGTTPGGCEIVNPMSDSTGWRRIQQNGFADSCSWKIKYTSLQDKTYYWSLQAIDTAFRGSAFATEVMVNGFTNTGATLTGAYNGSLTWGDYDNDNDLDLLLTGYNGGVSPYFLTKLYNNNGGSFTETGAALDGVYKSSSAWGDYDRDGDLDLLLTGYSSSTRISTVYRNDGSGTFVALSAGLPGVENGSCAWGDYDNDGDLDILLTGWTGSERISRIYRKDSGTTFALIEAGLTGVRYGCCAWGDLDRDGDLDILVCGDTGSGYVSKVYRNDGTDAFTDTGAGLTGVSAGSCAWGDHNNDGNPDILLCGDSGSGYVTKLYSGNGAGGFTDTGSGLPGLANGNAAWGDYDNDGDPDILLTGNSGSERVTRVYRNNGGGVFALQSMDLSGADYSSCAWADYDNDGDLDFALSGDTGSGYVTKIYRNDLNIANTAPTAPTNLQTDRNGDWVTFTWTASTDDHTPANGLSYVLRIGTTPGGSEISAAMSASNGYRRVAQSGYAHTCSWRIRDAALGARYYWSVQAMDGSCKGSSYATEASGGLFNDINAGLVSVGYSSVAWGDYDNDNDLDILIAGYTGTSNISRVYRNNGSSGFSDISAGLPGINDCSVAWGDYDNDTDLDILLTGSGISYVYRNDNGTFTNINAGLQGVYYSSAAWGDYDNDGDLDILLTGSGYSTVYRNDNGVFNNINAGLQGINYGSVAWGDYDQDGDLDILLTGSGYSKIYNNYNGLFTDIGAGLPGVQGSSTAWGDYDNDGDLDILLTGSDHSYVFRNDNGTFNNINAMILFDTSLGSSVWGDFDNDGDLDILITGDGNTYLYRNDNGTFTTIITYMSGVGYSDVAWGDYDNDGDLDILLTGFYGGYVSKIYRNDYNNHQPNTPPTTPSNLQTSADGDYTVLSWTASTDDHTPASGLNYVLRIGTTPGGNEISSAMSDSAGWRMVPQKGYANTCSWKIKTSAFEGQAYYWSVQAVDTGFMGSTFATEAVRPFIEVDAGMMDVKYSSSAWGDYDNDGDLDILLTGDTGSTSISCIYRNDSGYYTYVDAGLTGVSNGSVAWGDYDNDGDMDILLTGLSESGSISHIYRNNGNGTFTNINAGLTSVLNSSVAWGDYDNDGDLDILLTGYKNASPYYYAIVYRNNGDATYTDINAGLTGVHNGSCAWGDYDNDGDLDILLTGETGSTRISDIYRNDNGTFTNINAGIPGVRYGSVAWGDYDNDGDLDILLTGSAGSSDYVSRIYSNDNGIFTFVDAGLPGIFYSSCAWGDHDNDGDLDILLTGWTGSTRISHIYRNQGSGVFTDFSAGLQGVSFSSVAWGDYDNDGDLDLLMSGGTDSGRISRIYRNGLNNPNAAPTAPSNLQADRDGDWVNFSWTASTDDHTPAAGLNYVLRIGSTPGGNEISSAMSAANGYRRIVQKGYAQACNWKIDADKLHQYPRFYWSVQAVDGSYKGSALAAEVTGGWFIDIAAGLPGVNYSSSAWGDYDNDGDLDILLTGSGYSYVYRNDNGSFTNINAGLTGVSNSSAAWGDYDNDGDLDILLIGVSGSERISRIYRNDNTGFSFVNAGLPGVYDGSCAWGDYDNDGDLDILLSGLSNSGLLTRIYRNDGDSTFTDINAGLLAVAYSSVDWGDYDNDCDLDILLTGYNGVERCEVYRNDNGMFVDTNASLGGVKSGSAVWGDYDNDGDLDVLVAGSSSCIIFHNTGAAFSAYEYLTDISNCAAAWGDYDNDGDLDILVTGHSGFELISKIFDNDNGAFSEINAGLTGANRGSADWGDYDNDGDLDILLTGESYDGVLISNLYRNEYGDNHPNSPPVEPTNLQTSTEGDYTVFSWTASTDDHTPAAGLNYILRIGTTPGGNEISSALSDSSGWRRVPQRGYANACSWKVQSSALAEHSFYWSVQAVDTGFMGSAFATETMGGGFTQVTTSGYMVNQWGSSDWGDYDNDGDLDLLLTSGDFYDDATLLVRNDGDEQFSYISNIFPQTCNGDAVWGDYDNDGDLDVLLSGLVSGYRKTTVYQNNGGAFTDINAGLTGVDYSSVRWGDFDNDGDLDALVCGDTGNGLMSKMYYNSGDGIFTDSGINLEGMKNCSFDTGDYDNDGDLDIILTGVNSNGWKLSIIYRNDNASGFTDIGADLLGVYNGNVDWGDSDNDGDLDILMSGDMFFNEPMTCIYINENNSFTCFDAGLTCVSNSSAAWGDYDNDGDLDILLSGDGIYSQVSEVYRNNGSNSFTNINSGLRNRGSGSASWGDFDNDGDLDIFLSGRGGPSYWPYAIIYKNDLNNPNAAPSTPTNLQTSADGDSTIFSWTASTDDHTPASGLNYVLRIGTTPGGNEISSAMSDSAGWRMVPQKGYANTCSWKIKTSAFEGQAYYWSVQAVDTGYMGSAFATEASGGWFADINAGLPGVDNSSTAWGDYDNDGDLDLLLSGNSSTGQITHLYRNDDSTFVYVAAGLPSVAATSCSWGDYDNDGDLDILMSGSGISEVYRNDSGFFTDVNAGLYDYGACAWGDYDNDGDLDILLTASNSNIYRNDNGVFTNINAGLPVAAYSSCAWGDYDNDWDLDVLVTGWTGTAHTSNIYKNNNGSFVNINAGLLGVAVSSSTWGDYDNDGDLDVLITGFNYEGRHAKIYNNGGYDTFTDIEAGLTGVADATPQWGDYDNDGDLDILYSGHDPNFNKIFRLYRNDGSGVFTSLDMGITGTGWGTTSWADFDNDGDLDFIQTGNDGTQPVSRIFRNNSVNPNMPPSAPTNLQVGLDGEYIVFNWTASSDDHTPTAGLSYVLRIGTTPGGCEISASMSDSTGWRLVPQRGYANTCSWKIRGEYLYPYDTYYWSVQAVDTAFRGSAFAEERTDTLSVAPLFTLVNAGLPGVDYSSTAWGDFDNDGDLDLLQTGSNNISPYYHSTVYRNNGDETFTDISAGLPGVEKGSCAWGDYDNDGDLDILLTGDTGRVYIAKIYRNDNGLFTDINAGLPGVSFSSVAWGDYDNDGDLDILLTGSYTSLVYKNDNGTFININAGLPGVRYSSCAWGDYDNDGDLDILLTGDTGTSARISHIYRNDSGSFTYVDTGLPGVSSSSVAWGDYDNDGDLDILMTGNAGATTSRIYRNNGDGSFTDIAAGLTGVDWSSAAWGDWDNDGDLDIILAGYNNSVPIIRIYQNSGDSTFTEINASLPGVARGSVVWIDFDNDRDLDILLTGNTGSGSISRIYRNNYGNSYPNMPPSAPTSLQTGLNGDYVVFSWIASTDDHTPTAGLNYVLRIGTTPGGNEISSAMSDSSGWRMIPQRGNANACSWKIDASVLDSIEYFWAVQAVDTGFMGSAFSDEAMGSAISGFEEYPAGLIDVHNASAAWGDYDNDGDLDILLTGNADSLLVSRIYRNDGQAGFTDIGAGLPGVENGFCAWGDYDNDEDLDVLLSDSGSSKVYRNDGSNIFTDINLALPGVISGSVGWDDFDNDGDLDILLTGETGTEIISTLYSNEGNELFTNANAGLPGIWLGSAAWGDYDNDGDLDIVLNGVDNAWDYYCEVFRNDGGWIFTDVNAGLYGTESGIVNWADFDNDGDLDILRTGQMWGTNYTTIFRNDGGNIFTEVSTGMTGICFGQAVWGDYDNDGNPDILLSGNSDTGFVTKIYENDFGAFVDINADLDSLYGSCAAWGDYDNDGDLDFLLTGDTGSGGITRIYTNNYNTPNTPPTAPSNLQTILDGDYVVFSWIASTDDHTPSAGLDYVLRIGTTPGGNEISSAMSDSSGWRMIPQRGFANACSWKILADSLQQYGSYYWSVQAVDTGFRGSAFAEEQSVVTGGPPKAPENVLISAFGNDVTISWDAVTEDIYGAPLEPDHYNVYYSEAGDPYGNYVFLGSTESLTYTHVGAGLLAEQLFYYVKAFKDGPARDRPPLFRVSSPANRETGPNLHFQGLFRK